MSLFDLFYPGLKLLDEAKKWFYISNFLIFFFVNFHHSNKEKIKMTLILIVATMDEDDFFH